MVDWCERLDKLEGLHADLKSEYLKWAEERRLPNNGIGSQHNRKTIDFLKHYCPLRREIVSELKYLGTFIESNRDLRENYRLLRELYVIAPSLHELWFFEEHYNHLTGGSKLVTGRYGLLSYLTSVRTGTLSGRKEGIATFVLKRTILLENLFSGVLGHTLFDCSPLDESRIEHTIQNLSMELYSVSSPSPSHIKSVIPQVFEICLALFELTGFRGLRGSKLLGDASWLEYAPCSINEGPIFRLKKRERRTDILKQIASTNQAEIRKQLLNHFDIQLIRCN